MMAFSAAIFWVPMACTMVTMEPRASGMAATASATANIRESRMGICRYRLSRNTMPEITMITAASLLLNWSKLTCRGVFFSLVAFIRDAILPISVFIPVPVTTTTPRPRVTRELENTMFTWSARATLSSSSCTAFLSTLVDSPVRELSFTCRE